MCDNCTREVFLFPSNPISIEANAESGRELIYFRFHLSARRNDGEVAAARIKIERSMNFLLPNMAFIHQVGSSLRTDTKKIYTLRFKGINVHSRSMERV